MDIRTTQTMSQETKNQSSSKYQKMIENLGNDYYEESRFHKECLRRKQEQILHLQQNP